MSIVLHLVVTAARGGIMYFLHDLKLETQRAYLKTAPVIGWTIAGAVLGAVGGGLFGLLFGAFYAVLHGDVSRLMGMQAYFALCGAVAGALTGGFGRAIDAIGLPPTGSLSHLDHSRTESHGPRPDRIRPQANARRLIAVYIGPELPVAPGELSSVDPAVNGARNCI